MSEVKLPKELRPVLARIEGLDDGGSRRQWEEVVYHNGEKWKCLAGSRTFDDGESVIAWRYADELLPTTPRERELEEALRGVVVRRLTTPGARATRFAIRSCTSRQRRAIGCW